jgi:hypothetical protein
VAPLRKGRLLKATVSSLTYGGAGVASQGGPVAKLSEARGLATLREAVLKQA